MNLPNKISCVRIALLPIFVFFYLATFIPCNYLISAIIFTVAALTDMIDGKIARKYNLITDLGKFLDSIADKLIVVAALVLVTIDGTIPAPFGAIIAIVIISREFMVSALRQISAARGTVLAADMWGKYKATFQFISLPLLMFQAQAKASCWFCGTGFMVLEIINYVLLGVVTALTLVSAANYFIKNRAVLTEEPAKVKITPTVENKTEEK